MIAAAEVVGNDRWHSGCPCGVEVEQCQRTPVRAVEVDARITGDSKKGSRPLPIPTPDALQAKVYILPLVSFIFPSILPLFLAFIILPPLILPCIILPLAIFPWRIILP